VVLEIPVKARADAAKVEFLMNSRRDVSFFMLRVKMVLRMSRRESRMNLGLAQWDGMGVFMLQRKGSWQFQVPAKSDPFLAKDVKVASKSVDPLLMPCSLCLGIGRVPGVFRTFDGP